MALTKAGLEDMPTHFLSKWRPWFQDRGAWNMVRLGREVRSQTDYILGTYFHIFRNVAVLEPMHNLDHYLVLG